MSNRLNWVILALLVAVCWLWVLTEAEAQGPEFRLKVTWAHDGRNVDGSLAGDMDRFRLFVGTQPIPDNAGGMMVPFLGRIPATDREAVITLHPQPGWQTLYLRMDACDTSNNCSALSNEATHRVAMQRDTMAPKSPETVQVGAMP